MCLTHIIYLLCDPNTLCDLLCVIGTRCVLLCVPHTKGVILCVTHTIYIPYYVICVTHTIYVPYYVFHTRYVYYYVLHTHTQAFEEKGTCLGHAPATHMMPIIQCGRSSVTSSTQIRSIFFHLLALKKCNTLLNASVSTLSDFLQQ